MADSNIGKGFFVKSVLFYTLGCKVNQYETAAVAELFAKKGYRVIGGISGISGISGSDYGQSYEHSCEQGCEQDCAQNNEHGCSQDYEQGCFQDSEQGNEQYCTQDNGQDCVQDNEHGCTQDYEQSCAQNSEHNCAQDSEQGYAQDNEQSYAQNNEQGYTQDNEQGYTLGQTLHGDDVLCTCTANGKAPDVVVINTCAVTAESVRKSRQLIRKIKKSHSGAILAVVGCFSQIMREDVTNIGGVDVIMGTDDRGEIVTAVEHAVAERTATESEAAKSDVAGSATVERVTTGCAATVSDAAMSDTVESTATERATAESDATKSATAESAATECTFTKFDSAAESDARKYEELGVVPRTDRSRAFVKIQDGCSQFCAYCIVPIIRGAARSRNPKSVIRETESLISAGYKEIVLTGIHISSYGIDIKGGPRLDGLIMEISSLKGLERLRLGSIESTIVTSAFMESIKKCENVLCPHFHIPLQSGCNSILKKMNRKYTAEKYMEAIGLVRGSFPGAAITTDIIVGFPGESEEEFAESFEFCKNAGFSKMHVFKYSQRKGTAAAELKGQIEPTAKDRRSKAMIGLSKQMAHDFAMGFVGKSVSIVIEKVFHVKSGEAKYLACEGLTPHYTRVEARLCNSLIAKTGGSIIAGTGGSYIAETGGSIIAGKGGSYIAETGGSYIANKGGNNIVEACGNHIAAHGGEGTLSSLIGKTAEAFIECCDSDTLKGVCTHIGVVN